MPKYNPEKWCKQKGWSKPRKLEDNIWVAFPPRGVIETPLPNQLGHLEVQSKTRKFQAVLEVILLLCAVFIVGMIALIISPCFIVSMLRKHQLKQSSKRH